MRPFPIRSSRLKRKKDRVDSPLKGKIKCGCCGKNYLRKAYAYRTFWVCATYARKGKDGCSSKRIDEGELFKIIEELKIKIDSIREIIINNDIIEKNKDKAKKKQEKRGVYENQIRDAAAMKTRTIESKANINNYAELDKDSYNNVNKTYKPGSMAAKANMVRDYNEKNSRK